MADQIPVLVTIQERANFALFLGLESSLQNDTRIGEPLTLSHRSLLADPEVVKIIESHFRLRVTGNLLRLRQNYAKKYYTPNCRQRFTREFCLKMASRSDQLEAFKDMMLESESNDSILIIKCVRKASKYLAHAMMQFFLEMTQEVDWDKYKIRIPMRSQIVLEINSAMMSYWIRTNNLAKLEEVIANKNYIITSTELIAACRANRQDFFDLLYLHITDNVRKGDVVKAAARSGNLNLLKYVLAKLELRLYKDLHPGTYSSISWASILFYAAVSGVEEIFDFILTFYTEHFAAGHENHTGWLPAGILAYGRVDFADRVIALKPDVVDIYRTTFLKMAVKSGKTELIARFSEVKDVLWFHAIIEVSITHGYTDVLDFVLEEHQLDVAGYEKALNAAILVGDKVLAVRFGRKLPLEKLNYIFDWAAGNVGKKETQLELYHS